MGISFAVSVYDIEISNELFTIYVANGHIFTANICTWLRFTNSRCNYCSGFTSRNLRFCVRYFKAWLPLECLTMSYSKCGYLRGFGLHNYSICSPKWATQPILIDFLIKNMCKVNSIYLWPTIMNKFRCQQTNYTWFGQGMLLRTP